MKITGKLRFKPATLNGRPVSVRCDMETSFGFY